LHGDRRSRQQTDRDSTGSDPAIPADGHRTTFEERVAAAVALDQREGEEAGGVGAHQSEHPAVALTPSLV